MTRRIFAVAIIVLGFAAEAVSVPAPSKGKARGTGNGDMVTYVGCLRAEEAGERFMLTEISGPNAPRSRSWKTGFITKRTMDVEVAGPRKKLTQNVGRLVRITGRRSGHDIVAHSITYAGATCR